MHGGKTPKGRHSGNLKHGLYAAHPGLFSSRYEKRYARALLKLSALT
jgi:hypothetical protein